MAKINVLVEVPAAQSDAFSRHRAASESVRPGGHVPAPFDNGTSAAAPVAAGAAALLTSALGIIPPALLKAAMLASCDAAGQGWNADTGFGILNALNGYNEIAGRISSQPSGVMPAMACAASR